MAFKEIKFGGEMYQFKLNETLEGTLKEVRTEVGPNKSNVYVVDEKTFWGTNVLDVLLEKAPIGKKVQITLISENHKFPNGRSGKNFKVLVEE